MQKMLLVDDNPFLINVIKSAFGEYFDITGLSSSVDAISHVVTDGNNYDIFLCDYVMPDYYGTDVLKKAREVNPDGKRILYTGFHNRLDEIKDKSVYDLVIKKEMLEDISSVVDMINEISK